MNEFLIGSLIKKGQSTEKRKGEAIANGSWQLGEIDGGWVRGRDQVLAQFGTGPPIQFGSNEKGKGIDQVREGTCV